MLQLRPARGHRLANEFAHFERFRIEGLPLEQSAHLVDNGARTLVVLADVGNDLADFLKVRGRVLHDKLRRLRVAEDRTEWLIDFMRQRRGELAHHCDAAYVRDLTPQELCLLLGLFRRADIS